MKPVHTPLSRLQPALLLVLGLAACGGGGGGGGGNGGGGPGGGGAGDSDGDGLSDDEELLGWEIVVDTLGFGSDASPSLLTQRMVTSDPARRDTDGDGIDDGREFTLRSDPRRADTDGDGLADREELDRWRTSLISVDSDGDARGEQGNLPPSPDLFDGAEVATLGTSPTLDDTDGDGRSDHREADDPALDPRIADLPRASVEADGELSIVLNVEYAEAQGSEETFGVSQSTSTTSSSGSSAATTIGVTSTYSYGWSAGGTAGYPYGGSYSAEVNEQYSDTTLTESTTTVSQEFARTAAAEYSRLVTRSRLFTETVATGTLSLGLAIANTGASTFTLQDLGVTVLQWRPGGPGERGTFRTVATLLPDIGSVTLPPIPGQRHVVRVAASDVNAGVVREFLAQPSSLVLRPSSYALLGEGGVDFDFLNQETYARTAVLSVDFGGGDVRTWRVATNVARGANGEFLGLSVGDALALVGLSFQTAASVDGDGRAGPRVLTGVDGRSSIDGGPGSVPAAFWSVTGTRPQFEGLDFEAIRLAARDELHLVYVRDQDLDGLYDREEAFHGTSDSEPDSDGDGTLSDRDEVKVGWMAGEVPAGATPLPGYPRRVTSDPRVLDTDQDGFDDVAEFVAGTDPRNPDTDEDGLSDALDPFPLQPATRLHVDAAAPGGNGLSWATAFADLAAALAECRARNTSPDPSDDVSQLWVARGVYTPHPTSIGTAFLLAPDLAVYGGFQGGERKLGERDADPFSNGTILSGRLSSGQRAWTVVRDDGSIGASSALDGFTIEGGLANGGFSDGDAARRGGGFYLIGSPTLRNLLVLDNFAALDGGGLYQAAGRARLEDCTFLGNEAGSRGGGAWLRDSRVEGCAFLDNVAAAGAGALAVAPGLDLRATLFRGNAARLEGGGLYASRRARIERCTFEGNRAFDVSFSGPRDALGHLWNAAGGAINYSAEADEDLLVLGSSFFDNEAGDGAAIQADSVPGFLVEVRLVNCTIAGNRSNYQGALRAGAGLATREHPPQQGHPFVPARFRLENSILWGNRRLVNGNTPTFDESAQLYYELAREGTLVFEPEVAYTCLQDLHTLGLASNLTSDPAFRSLATGDLRLSSSSPCIDAGSSNVDLDPATPGLQGPGTEDLDGNPRRVDGDGDGRAEIDMGALEFQR